VAGEACGATGAEGFAVGAADGVGTAGEAWASSGAAACGLDATVGEVLAGEGWAAARGAGRSGDTATAASSWAAALGAAWEVNGKTFAGVSDAGLRASEALVGPAATTANPTRGRNANVRREPALGRRTILRGLAPAMEEERLVRRSRESG
jgi:hypothetical protein